MNSVCIQEAVNAKLKANIQGLYALSEYEFLLLEYFEKTQIFQVAYDFAKGYWIEEDF